MKMDRSLFKAVFDVIYGFGQWRTVLLVVFILFDKSMLF